MAYFAGITLISTATILLELALLRLFAVQQFYHFAFMAISLALLGAGASGSFLSAVRRRYSPIWLCQLFALAIVVSYLVLNYLPFDSFAIAWDRLQILYLALYFLVAAVPFFFSGLVIGGELMEAGKVVDSGVPLMAGSHRVYGANLMGSAAGALITLPLLTVFGGERMVIVAAILGATGGLFFCIALLRANHRTGQGRLGLAISLILIIGGMLSLAGQPQLLVQQLSPYKALSVLKQSINARQVLTLWSASARVDVVDSETIHVMPGLSLLSPVGIPPQAGLMLDGDELMPITGLGPDSKQAGALADFVPNGLAYRLRPEARTLVIEAGTGMDVLFALASGASRVTAVEENRLVTDVVADKYWEFTGGLYTDPRVELVNQSGRVFARQGAKTGDGGYDVVVLSLTEPHRPVTSGAYSLTENYLYTTEAFADFLQLLDEDGLLVITRWLQSPPSESGRTFGIIVDALEKLGLDPDEHLLTFRTLRTMTVVAGSQPFTEEEVNLLRDYLIRANFDAVYFPGIRQEELNRYGVLEEPLYHDLFVSLLDNPEEVYDGYRFNIKPPSDNQPFFYHYFKWSQTPEILAGLGYNWQPFGGSGYFVLVALLIVVILASVVLIISPLLLRRMTWTDEITVAIPKWRWRVFLYFACLGLAFLFVEIPLAQRFILILDQPVTALAVVLFAVLLFSGLGSLSVRRLPLSWSMAALIVLIAVYPFLLSSISTIALSLPAWGRIGLAVIVLAPLGYLMGLPFAGGLRVVEKYESGLVPWAWAINGTFSVISSVLAVLIALSWGFSAVLWFGAAAYTLSLLALRRWMIPPVKSRQPLPANKGQPQA